VGELFAQATAAPLAVATPVSILKYRGSTLAAQGAHPVDTIVVFALVCRVSYIFLLPFVVVMCSLNQFGISSIERSIRRYS